MLPLHLSTTQSFAKMWKSFIIQPQVVLIVRKYTFDLCSNTQSLNSILYSLGLKDYSFKAAAGKACKYSSGITCVLVALQYTDPYNAE